MTDLERKISSEELKQMRKAGMSKPSSVTWAEWNAPFKISSIHEMMCYQHATGSTVKRIAEEIGYSRSQVSKILNSAQCKFRIQEIQFMLYGKNSQKRFEMHLDEAITVTTDVMNKPNAKDSTRLRAANIIMDRALGKPKQEVEIRDSTLKDLYNKLDELDIYKKPRTIKMQREEIPDAEIIEKNESPEENQKKTDEDAVDNWIEANYE